VKGEILVENELYNGPWWRSNGSILIANQLVEDLFYYLGKWKLFKEDKLPEEDRLINWRLPIDEDDDLNEFFIKTNGMSFAVRAQHLCQLVMLMCAIYIEDQVNKFLVFNIDESIVDSIERMNPLQKLEIASAILEQPKFKGTHIYQKLKSIVEWRNQFAHGKLDDMPKQQSLRKTHLEHTPEKYPSLKSEIEKLIATIDNTNAVYSYLQQISKHEYTSWGSSDLDMLVENNEMIKKFYEKYIKSLEEDSWFLY
jgi:hypothetical protein